MKMADFERQRIASFILRAKLLVIISPLHPMVEDRDILAPDTFIDIDLDATSGPECDKLIRLIEDALDEKAENPSPILVFYDDRTFIKDQFDILL